MSDPLEDVLHLESQFYEEGHAAGRAHNEQYQREQGLKFGLKQGRDVGLDLGHIDGFCLVMRRFLENLESRLDDQWMKDDDSGGGGGSGGGERKRLRSSLQRLFKTLEQMEQMVQEFPKTREELFAHGHREDERSDNSDHDDDGSPDVRQRIEQIRGRHRMFLVRWNLFVKQLTKSEANAQNETGDGEMRTAQASSLGGSTLPPSLQF